MVWDLFNMCKFGQRAADLPVQACVAITYDLKALVRQTHELELVPLIIKNDVMDIYRFPKRGNL